MNLSVLEMDPFSEMPPSKFATHDDCREAVCACCGVKTPKKKMSVKEEASVIAHAKPEYDSKVRSFPAGLCKTCRCWKIIIWNTHDQTLCLGGNYSALPMLTGIGLGDRIPKWSGTSLSLEKKVRWRSALCGQLPNLPGGKIHSDWQEKDQQIGETKGSTWWRSHRHHTQEVKSQKNLSNLQSWSFSWDCVMKPTVQRFKRKADHLLHEPRLKRACVDFSSKRVWNREEFNDISAWNTKRITGDFSSA